MLCPELGMPHRQVSKRLRRAGLDDESTLGPLPCVHPTHRHADDGAEVFYSKYLGGQVSESFPSCKYQ